MLLGEWDAGKSVQNAFSASIKDVLLQTLAFEIHAKQEKQFSGNDLERNILKIFADRGAKMKESQMRDESQSLADELIFRSSLIKQSVDRLRSYWGFEFAHLSFQEFFCAKYLMRTSDARTIQLHLSDEWWKIAFVFYFGLKESMDGVAIPTGKSSERHGIALMDFLSEATFTSLEARQRVYQIMSNELLYSMSVTSAELEICAQAGDAFVETVRKKVVNEAFDGITLNYLRLLTAAGTGKARTILEEDRAMFGRLNDRELMVILCEITPFLRYAGWAGTLRGILEHVKGLGGVTRSKSDWDLNGYLQTFRKDLRKAVKESLMSHYDAEGLNNVLKSILRVIDK